MRKTGYYDILGDVHYFVPAALPPQNPTLTITAELIQLYGEAMLELGKLNEMATRLPNVERFIKAYVIKEALLSSSIEGINTTLLDVFTQPLSEHKPNKDTQSVMNYTKALGVAYEMIRKQNFPVTTRVILKAHEMLMKEGEGDKANPGHYRKQSVRVGQLIPPPPSRVIELMDDLERYINLDESLPPLIKAGLAHVQFETIHPFLDGNGRIGRLLIVLMLIDRTILAEPILYISYYFKKHHMEYYQRLDRVRTHGDFEGWVTFYLQAMKESCIDAHRRAKDIEALEKELTDLIIHEKKCSIAMRDMRLHALSILFCCPVISVGEMSRQLSVAFNTAHRLIKHFIKLGLVVKEPYKKRGKLFRFKNYLDILDRVYDGESD